MEIVNYIEEKYLPCDLSSERVVIGNVLSGNLSPECFRDTLPPGSFHREFHRHIATVAMDLQERGDPVSYISIFEEMGRRNYPATLSELIDVSEGMPDVTDFAPYFRAINRYAVRRRAIHVCHATMNKLLLEPDIDSVMQEADRVIHELGESLDDSSDLNNPGKVISEEGGLGDFVKKGLENGILTPWKEINSLTRGLRPRQMIVLAGNTGRGKTSLALNIGHHAAMCGVPVAFYSMEMGRREIVSRLIGISGNMDMRKLRNPSTANGSVHEIVEAAGKISDIPFYICDRSACTAVSIEASIRRMNSKYKIGLVIIDYLTLMSSTGRAENRTQEVSKISRAIKLMAMNLEIPIIAVCQLNRSAAKDKNRRPELHDLRDTGAIENDADAVCFLHSENQYDKNTPGFVVDFIIPKQRSGPSQVIVKLWFNPASGVFSELEPDREESVNPAPRKPTRDKDGSSVAVDAPSDEEFEF